MWIISEVGKGIGRTIKILIQSNANINTIFVTVVIKREEKVDYSVYLSSCSLENNAISYTLESLFLMLPWFSAMLGSLKTKKKYISIYINNVFTLKL